MNTLLVMKQAPSHNWVKSLKKNDLIWLVKEKCFAIIDEWYRSLNGGQNGPIGKITLRRLVGLNPVNVPGFTPTGDQETWLVKENGQGLDNSQIIMPVMEVGQDYSMREIGVLLSQIQQQLASVSERLSALEKVGSPPEPVRVRHTNGYCDTCGDMYVKGYERCHPKCRKENDDEIS